MKALIVDDSRAIRMILKKFLVSQGFDTFVEAGNGQEALDRLSESGVADLALVDWNMPVMDGLQLVGAVRENKGFDAMRLVMVTTESESTQMQRAIDAGASGYITKPFTTETLREKLQALGFKSP